MAYNASILPGYGYWDTTYYPRGGCFRRSPRDTGIRCVVTGKAGHEVTVQFSGTDGKRSACVDPRGLQIDAEVRP